MIRNFIFDLDGTLVDSLPGIAGSVRFALQGTATYEGDLREHIGPPIRSILAALSGAKSEAELDRLEARFRRHYDSAGWRDTVAYQGVAEMLSQLLESGARLFVVTNKPLTPASRILRMLELRNCFDDLVTPDSSLPVFESKSEMLHAFLAQWNLRPGDCVYVGDTVDDLRAAQSAGMDSVFMAHGYGAQRLRAEAPDACLLPHAAALTEHFLFAGATL